MSLRRSRFAYLIGVALLCVLIVTAQTAGAAGGGAVLAGNARPHGYTLSQMAALTAPFTFSGNDPSLLPATPFQVLYIDPSTSGGFPDGCGFVSTGTNTITVAPGKSFYVPLINIDDAPPVIGTFPTTAAAAQSYFFDASQLGGRDFQIDLDGHTTALGGSYLSGPVETPPLADGGTHVVTLGAFMAPMTPGTHTVTLTGGLFGAAIMPALGVCSFGIDYTYTVNVTSTVA